MKQACRACKAHDARLLFDIGGNRVVRCCRCSHVYLDVVHDNSSIDALYAHYEERYFDRSSREIEQETLTNFDTYLENCRRFCLSLPAGPRLLDIGCGAGHLLERAQKHGFEVEGQDICGPLLDMAARRFGCTVHRGFLCDVELPPHSFDVIAMVDVLEHLKDPETELGLVRTLRKPGGILFILTPNDQALVRRLAKLSYTLSFHRFVFPMKSLYYIDHLSYFNRRSLSLLLKRTGFEMVHCETKNPELTRLSLPPAYRFCTKLLFLLSGHLNNMAGKLIVYAK